jgi:hypothetical protein
MFISPPPIAVLLSLVMAWMTSLAPGRDHSELAWAVTINSANETEAAVLTAVAFRESSLRNHISGDGGHAVCAMQIYDGPKSLLSDPVACVARGAKMLRESRRVDPANPIAFYARGPRFRSEEAQRISRDRMAMVRRLLSSTATP